MCSNRENNRDWRGTASCVGIGDKVVGWGGPGQGRDLLWCTNEESNWVWRGAASCVSIGAE